MKKNFFKKLSFVMASAMLISTVAPAAGANAAATPALNATKKYLHLSGISGPNAYDFNIKNKASGWKYAWSSANEDVATVDNVGLTTAQGVGTTKVTVNITKSGKKVKDLSATVVVRDNIETVKIKNAPEGTLKVNEVYDFNRSFVTESGSTKKTSSITRWTVDKDTATIDDAGKFVATEAGEYKVTALSFQSKEKYQNWLETKDEKYVLATDEATVKVAPSMTVNQVDLDTIKLTFDSPVEDIAKKINVYTVVGNTEVAVTTAKAPSVSEDKKTVTLDFFVNLTPKATYVVKVDGVDPVQFVAAESKFENVRKVEIATTEAVVNEATTVKVKLLDENNVDITTDTLKDKITYESSSSKVSYYKEGNDFKLIFMNKGDTTQVTATLHSYKFEGGKEVGNIVGSGTVVGVDAASVVVGDVKAWTLADVGNGPDWKNPKTVITAKQSKDLYVELKTKKGTDESTVKNYGTDANDFEFTSSNTDVLFINGKTLHAVKAGSVSIVVKYKGTAVQVINLTVGDERKAQRLEFNTGESVTLSNTTNFTDTATVKVTVKDQYNDNVTGDANLVKYEKVSGPSTDLVSSVTTNAITFKGYAALKGTYTYKLTKNGVSQYITVNVLEPTGATPTSYSLELGGLEVDAKSTKDDATPSIDINLYGMAGAKVTPSIVTGAGFKVEVRDPDGNVTELTKNSYDLYELTTTVSGNVIKPKKNGPYTVTAKQLKDGNWVTLQTKTFVVKNSQLKPTFEIKNKTYNVNNTGYDKDVIARACFKVFFDGVEKTDFVMGDYTGTLGQNIVVKTIKWTETITDNEGTYQLVHEIEVNQYLSAY